MSRSDFKEASTKLLNNQKNYTQTKTQTMSSSKQLSMDETIKLYENDHSQRSYNSRRDDESSRPPRRPFNVPLSSQALSHRAKAEMKQKEKMLALDEQFSIQTTKQVFSTQAVSSLEGHISPTIIKNLTEFMKIDTLTNIQSRSLIPILGGEDILLKSETGSGKTLAYVIPLVQKLFELSVNEAKVQRSDGTLALILAPTRELCIQIESVVKKVAVSFPWMVSGTVMGGEDKKKEKSRLRKGVTVLIATPGRLEDHLKTTQSFKYDALRHIILDEADRLLDLGFEKTVGTIFSILQQNRALEQKPQTILISATLHAKIQRLATSIGISNAKYIGFSNADDESTFEEKNINLEDEKIPSDVYSIPSALKQFYVMSPGKLRLPLLASFLLDKTSATSKKAKVVVFLSCCDSVEYHHSLFTHLKLKKLKGGEEGANPLKNFGKMKLVETPFFGVPLFKLHGDMTQKERTKVYFDFCNATSGVLLCTDVAARGLDLPAVDWIVQYDAPGTPKEYLHRIGRTARLGHQGSAVIFLMPHELLYLKLLEKYNLTLKEIPGSRVFKVLMEHVDKRVNNESEAGNWLLNICANVTHGTEFMTKKALAAYQSHIRYYATHSKDTKIIFHINNLHLGHVAASFGLRDKPSELRKKQGSLGETALPISVKKEQKEKQYAEKDKHTDEVFEKSQRSDAFDGMRTRKPRTSSNLPKDEDELDTNFEVVSTTDTPKIQYESMDEVEDGDDDEIMHSEKPQIFNKFKVSTTTKKSADAATTKAPAAAKKKKLSTAERLQRYKDFTKGRLQRDRPAIVIPDGMFKAKKNVPQAQPRISVGANAGAATRKQQSAMLRNPFNKRERSMGGMVNEFDSGFSSATKARRLN